MLRKLLLLGLGMLVVCAFVISSCDVADRSTDPLHLVDSVDTLSHDPPVLILTEGLDIPQEYLKNMTGDEESAYTDSSRTTDQMNPSVASIGAWTSIAWPFKYESPNLWRGDEGDRSGGSMIWSCGAYIHSHSGADHYARDLSRYDGTSHNRSIYAGRSGWVAKAGWDGGYGNVVVIWDPANKVCIRYAHLNSVSVYPGQYVTIRQFIGRVGNSPGGFASHLHLVAYENVDTNRYGLPIVPHLCMRDNWHSCRVYFFS